MLPDPSMGGRERRFRVEDRFCTMTRKEAKAYMEKLATAAPLPYAAAQQPQPPPSGNEKCVVNRPPWISQF